MYIIKYSDSWKSISEKQAPIENSGVYTTSVTGITEFSKFTIGGESATLPVTWLSFTGNEENGMILLSWKTASEVNNKGFEIQRSSDGKVYQTIGFVQGTGNSNQIQGYSFKDGHAGIQNRFYRLKQVDYDGKFDYSKIIYIPSKSTLAQFYIYPNPTTAQVRLWSTVSASEHFYLRLLGTDSKVWINMEGTIEKLNRYINEYIPSIPIGVYLLQIIENSEVFSLKLIKKD